jgi:hypothetical protein
MAPARFEFSARDVGEAGGRLNGLLAHAAEHRMETRSLELSTRRVRR